MAELFGVAASIIAIIQISDRIVSLAKLYIESSRDAPKDLWLILNEISTVKVVFENLKFLIDTHGADFTLLSQLNNPEGPIAGCRNAIADLESLIGTDAAQTIIRGKRGELLSIFAKLAWPLKETKARKLLDDITRHKTTINLALANEAAIDIKRLRNGLGNLQRVVDRTELQSILGWLVTVDPSPNHNRAFDLHEQHTGKWLLRSPEWHNWLLLETRFLWLHGIPGSGKTVLSSYIVHEVQNVSQKNSHSNNAWAYYYCYHGRNHDETSHCLRWIINQLCRQMESAPLSLRTLYQLGSQPTIQQLLDVLESVANCFDLVYVVIDALDESRNRENIALTFANLILQERFRMLRVTATSRDEMDIRRALEHVASPISMCNTLVQDDIQIYVHTTLSKDSKFRRWPVELLLEIEHALVYGARGMFRWVFCQIEVLRRVKNEAAARKCMHELPKGLDETYERILTAIPDEERSLALHALWLLCSPEERLTAEMLLVAIAESCTHDVNCVDQGFVDWETIKEICSCLISVSDELTENEYGGIGHAVVLAHYTVKEYLLSDRIRDGPASQFYIPPQLVARPITKLMLRHFVCFIDSSDDRGLEIDSSLGALRDYCTREGPLIIDNQQALIASDPDLFSSMIQLTHPSNPKLEEVLEIFRTELEWFGLNEITADSSDSSVLTLRNLISIGYISLATAYLSGMNDLQFIANTRTTINGAIEGTLLETCALLRTGPLVEAFLDAGAKAFDRQSILYRILGPSTISRGTCSRVVGAFIRAGANIQPPGFAITPLQAAVQDADIEFVQILLEAGADPDAIGEPKGQIPSECNAEYGNQRPLWICRNIVENREARLSIEDLLLQYGAENLS